MAGGKNFNKIFQIRDRLMYTYNQGQGKAILANNALELIS